MTLASCSTVSHTASTQAVDTRISSMTVADLKVDTTKITKTVNWNWTPLRSVSMSETKTNATGELLIEQKADVLVEPQYIVKRRGIFRGGSVTVTGYPASYHNFRPMTKEDAEMIAAANGDIRPGVPVVVESSAAFSPFRKQKSKSVPLFSRERKPIGGTFVSLIGGPAFAVDDDYYDTGVNLGLMFGHYGARWGYYLKAAYLGGESPSSSDYYDDGEKTKVGIFTAGAIKTLGRNNNIFFGAGVGVYHYNEHYDNGNGNGFALPFEIGWQWHSGRFNAMAGVTGVYNYDGTSFVSPFVGIGYNF